MIDHIVHGYNDNLEIIHSGLCPRCKVNRNVYKEYIKKTHNKNENLFFLYGEDIVSNIPYFTFKKLIRICSVCLYRHITLIKQESAAAYTAVKEETHMVSQLKIKYIMHIADIYDRNKKDEYIQSIVHIDETVKSTLL